MHLFSARQVCGCGLWRGRLVGRMHIYLARARFVVVGCGLWRGRLVGRMHIYRDGYKIGG